jgi:cell wall-associated NlpC family hydrolase
MRFNWKKKACSLLLLFPFIFIFSAFTNNNTIHDTISEVSNFSSEDKSVVEFRSELIEKANKYIGSRYRSNGAGPKAFDCSGFTSFVFSNYGLQLERSSRNQSKVGKRVPIYSAQPGDLVFFAVKGNVHHVGIIVKNEGNQLWMIHSSTSRGVIVEEILGSAYWRKRLLLVRDVVSDMKLENTQVNNPESF